MIPWPPTAARRSAASLLGALWLLIATFLGPLHESSIEHTICEVHQQIEHVTADHHDTDRDVHHRFANDGPADGIDSPPVETPAHDDEREACGFEAARISGESFDCQSGAHAVVGFPDASARESLIPLPPHRPGVGLLRWAPKTSPPVFG